MGLISLLIKDPVLFVMIAVPLLYSIIAHEVAHGWTAYLFGDNTAKYSGRLSLNPAKHLDPMGTLMLFFVGFGWAKPVPVDYRNLKNFRVGLIVVSLAGCLTNILIATIALFLLRLNFFGGNSYIAIALTITAKINIMLGSFNLIPIPPLDGSKILMGFLPHEGQRKLAQLEPYGFFIIIFMLFTGLLRPIIRVVQTIILTLIDFIL